MRVPTTFEFVYSGSSSSSVGAVSNFRINLLKNGVPIYSSGFVSGASISGSVTDSVVSGDKLTFSVLGSATAYTVNEFGENAYLLSQSTAASNVELHFGVVPEPGTIIGMSVALASLAQRRRRSDKHS